MNLIAIAGAIVFALLAIIGYQHLRIGNLKEKDAKYELVWETYKGANKTNQETIQVYKEVAAKNFAQAERVKKRQDEAVKRNEIRVNNLETDLEKLRGREQNLRTRIVGSCVAADDPAFIEFLCSGPLGCPST